MDEMIIQSANEATRMAPVRSSTNSKLAEERLARKSVENNSQAEEKKKSEEPSSKSIETAVSEINNYVEKFSTKISFSIDAESERPMIIVKDSETGEVIRQIPAKELLSLSEKMEEIAGIIFDGRV
jgi:flagellar protein FlaG